MRIQINAFDDDRIAHLPDDQLSISELRGRAASNFYQCTVQSWDHARQLMDRALRLNPVDPMALAMHAESVVMISAARYEILDAEQIEQLANQLNRAVELSPRSDYIFTARAFFRIFVLRDVIGAIRDSERALSLNPGYHIAYDTFGMAHLLAGDTGNAIRDLQKAVSLSATDPLLPHRLFLLAIAYHFENCDADALDTIDRAILLGPNQRNFHILKMVICRAIGDADAESDAEVRASQLPWEPSIMAPRLQLPEDKADFVKLFSPN